MEFKKRQEYSIDRSGWLYQVSQDEFLHCSYGVLTWMKGNKRIEQQFEYDAPLGVVGNSFFFRKDRIIKKAELINEEIVISEFLTIENGMNVFFKGNCLHYFIERDNNKNVSFAIPVNEDYRSKNGININASIDELNKYYPPFVHNNFLFGITYDGNSSSIRRYQSDSEKYLEKKELPWIYLRLVVFSNWIFYLNPEGSLISVNMNDLSYEIIKTNLGDLSSIVGIDENGIVNVQTNFYEPPFHLFTSQLPEKYINQANMPKFIDTNMKRIEELERKVERKGDKEKKEEELERKLEDQNKKEEELERRLEDQKKNEEELERRLKDQKKNEEELERRLKDQKKNEEELERRLEDQKKKEEELERRLEDQKKKEEEIESRLEDQKKKEEEIESRLEDKEKSEEELEKRNAIMEMEMTELQQKYNKLLVRISKWDEKK